jgi:hypothetical protein
MKKLFLLAVPFLLLGCGPGESEIVSDAIDDQPRPPTYCIRSIVINEDGTFLLDMPGWPHGMDDSPILVTTLDGLNENTTNCTPDDPRMQ